MSALHEVLRVLGTASEPLTARQIHERMPDDYTIEQVWNAASELKSAGKAVVIDGTKPAQYVLAKGTEIPAAAEAAAAPTRGTPKPARAPKPERPPSAPAAPAPAMEAPAPGAPTVVIYGPQGSGKTHLAEHLRKHYGCTSVVDGWHPPQGLIEGALHLATATAEELTRLPRHVQIVDIFDALRGHPAPITERPRVLAAPPAQPAPVSSAARATGGVLPAMLLSRRLSAVALLLAQWPDETIPHEALLLLSRMTKDADACAA